jgi:hypothetical protein
VYSTVWYVSSNVCPSIKGLIRLIICKETRKDYSRRSRGPCPPTIKAGLRPLSHPTRSRSGTVQEGCRYPISTDCSCVVREIPAEKQADHGLWITVQGCRMGASVYIEQGYQPLLVGIENISVVLIKEFPLFICYLESRSIFARIWSTLTMKMTIPSSYPGEGENKGPGVIRARGH